MADWGQTPVRKVSVRPGGLAIIFYIDPEASILPLTLKNNESQRTFDLPKVWLINPNILAEGKLIKINRKVNFEGLWPPWLAVGQVVAKQEEWEAGHLCGRLLLIKNK